MRIIKMFGCVIAACGALLMSGCSKDDNPSNDNENTVTGDGSLTLAVSKDSIKSDSRDKASFTVMFGETDVTADAQIIDNDGNSLKNDYFTSRTPGEYSFTAHYTDNGKEYVSNSVSVKVNALEITASMTEVPFGAQVKFTVKYLDEDVTAGAVITNVTDNTEVENAAFTAPGYITEYEFEASYAGMQTERITVQVVAPASSLRLKQSKARVADGETVQFTVMLNGSDVTSSATITNITAGSPLSGATYAYDGNGATVQFQAEYDGQTSQVVSVGTSDFYKKLLAIEFSSVLSSESALMAASFEKALQAYPDRVAHVECHHPLMGNDPLLPDSMYQYQLSFGVDVMPTIYLDYYANKLEGFIPSSDLVASLRRGVATQPATTGIAAECAIKSATTAELTVNVTAADNKEYSLCVMVLENGIEHDQTGGSKNQRHNHVLRHLGTGIFGESLGVLAENQQVTRNFQLNLSRIQVPENCTVVCSVLTKTFYPGSDEEYWIVNNTAELYINGSVDYRFE